MILAPGQPIVFKVRGYGCRELGGVCELCCNRSEMTRGLASWFGASQFRCLLQLDVCELHDGLPPVVIRLHQA